MNDYITIEDKHVGQPILRAFGKPWLVSSFAGRILPQDVSKRVYLRGGILQMESEHQRDEREELEKLEALNHA